jgi:hypothetical protein
MGHSRFGWQPVPQKPILERKERGFFYFFSVVLFYFILSYILLYVYIYYNKKNDWRRLKCTFGNKNCFLKKIYLKIY